MITLHMLECSKPPFSSNNTYKLLKYCPNVYINTSTQYTYLYQAFFVQLDPSKLDHRGEGNKNMGGGRSFVSEKMKLLVALLILQLCFAGFHIVSRVALNIGISKVVYPVYRNIIALLMLGPFSYFFEKCVILIFSTRINKITD